MTSDLLLDVERVMMAIRRFFPKRDESGRRIVYGLRDCCKPGSGHQPYGPHEPWCRYAK